MSTIRIYRKAVAGKAVNNAAARKAVADGLAVCRVRRPELEEFFLSGEFRALPALPSAIVDNPHKRVSEHAQAGWTVPEGSLGRTPKNGERDYASTSQSVLIWIKRYFAPILLDSEVSVVVED